MTLPLKIAGAPASADRSAALIAVARAASDLRRGGLVVIEAGGAAALVLAAETADDAGLQRLRALAAGAGRIALTRQRARALGFGAAPGGGVVAPALAPDLPAAALLRLADPTAGEVVSLGHGEDAPAAIVALAEAAVELAKLARLLPAAALGPLGSPSPVELADWAAAQGLLRVSAAHIADYPDAVADTLRPVGEARVPLAQAETTRIVAFRPADGGVEHLAIVIGEPSPAEPVLTRLHSECFTGDLLGSLRCDCGDQLRGAIGEIARRGSGVLLYLAQEGRGIGLVNKLRAYGLQDRGADTVEANRQLGFEADERLYRPAAEMLRQLGILKVRLMTNNPAKVAGLERCGIAVAERVPLVFPANPHNDRYLATKATRFGHLF
jgi:GTP cyclohydrolase II